MITKVLSGLYSHPTDEGPVFTPDPVASHPERGDVPGWVMVTMMTAGLVVAVSAIAIPALTGLFSDAIASVTGP